MENNKNGKLNFYTADGKKVDIRDEDLSLGIDLVKNAQNEIATDPEMDPKEKTETLECYFRLWQFLVSIRTGLRPQGH